jgi:hypothetical protein
MVFSRFTFEGLRLVDFIRTVLRSTVDFSIFQIYSIWKIFNCQFLLVMGGCLHEQFF